MMTSSDYFRDKRYVTVRNLLSPAVRAFLHEYGLKSAHAGTMRTDGTQVPETPYCYADPLMEALLEVACPQIENEIGIALYPTYSFFRVYRRGDVLHRHTDRPACEVSVTICLGGDEPWPIWIDAGRPMAIVLHPGDALIYRGIDVPHWREAYIGQDAVQVFLHYVERDGTNKEWMFDKRERLATNATSRQLVQRQMR